MSDLSEIPQLFLAFKAAKQLEANGALPSITGRLVALSAINLNHDPEDLLENLTNDNWEAAIKDVEISLYNVYNHAGHEELEWYFKDKNISS